MEGIAFVTGKLSGRSLSLLLMQAKLNSAFSQCINPKKSLKEPFREN